MQNHKWYAVEIFRAHRDRSSRLDSTIDYIFAENLNEVLNRRKKMPGTKRTIGHKSFPNIRPLLEQEAHDLERYIINERRIDIEKAKRIWYYKNMI